MFEELKELLAAENMKKIRMNQRQLQKHSEEVYSEAEDSWISQDDELSERVEIFKTLMEERSHSRSMKVTQTSLLNQKTTKLWKEKELLEQRMLIERQNQERELSYLKENHGREIEVLKAEIEKYRYQLKKMTKEEGALLTLKKENRQLAELQSQCSHTAERLTNQNATLRKEILSLKATIKQKEENETAYHTHQNVQSQNEKILKQNVEDLIKERNMQTERRKQMQSTVTRLRLENEDAIRELDRVRVQRGQQKMQIMDKCKMQMSRIEEENCELKRRNQKLEESFIEHLTQTSLNLQMTLKNQPDKSAKNTTLYLQETPIKSRSRDREPKSPEEEDPEKSQCMGKKCDCDHQMARLKVKLRQANSKIVDLLQEKCWNYRQK